jgi:membrane protein
MTEADPPRRQSLFGAARELVAGVVQLARLEATRGRQEMGQMLAQTKTGALLIGIGVVLVFMAIIALVLFIVLLLSTLTGLPGWLVALIVFVVLALLAALLAYRGIKMIRIGPPEETIEAVKEDIAWAKRLMRRG